MDKADLGRPWKWGVGPGSERGWGLDTAFLDTAFLSAPNTSWKWKNHPLSVTPYGEEISANQGF